jgi:hypothetical protein
MPFMYMGQRGKRKGRKLPWFLYLIGGLGFATSVLAVFAKIKNDDEENPWYFMKGKNDSRTMDGNRTVDESDCKM